jgi:processive 1,2-diacylglycerol beta-glucosyltransferase
MIRRVERHLHQTLLDFQPDLVASTYPLYPYFLHRSFQSGVPRRPVATIVTDSFNINAAWRNAPSDYWLVTDSGTRRCLLDHDLPEGRVVETGFPVDPRFSELTPVPADHPAKPFRVLYFPTSKKPTVRRVARAVLKHDGWPTEITIVLGRNVRTLYKRARELQAAYPGRVRIKGWTKKVPELLCSHHLVVGKAGGATVHEALAARCPMLIHHLVPGQEVGNLELLRRIGGGDLADTPESLAAGIRDLTADQADLWRRQKRNLARHARPNASAIAARFLLDTISAQQPS